MIYHMLVEASRQDVEVIRTPLHYCCNWKV